MHNKVTLIGFTGSTPETRTTSSGQLTCLSLATSRPRRGGKDNAEGSTSNVRDTEWHRVTCWGGLAKTVVQGVGKGARLLVTGRLHYSRWTDRDGKERHGCEIIAEEVKFLSRAKVQSDQLALAF